MYLNVCLTVIRKYGLNPSFRFVVLLVLGAWIAVNQAHAQVVSLYDVIYRPPGVEYRVLSDGQFNVIYQKGTRTQAEETLWMLRQTLQKTNDLLGSKASVRLSVVLNDFSDSGNGYVTPFPFKSEIESVALLGRGLSRRHPSWTQLVTTHELVHAAQAEFENKTSLVGLIGLFAPDFARAINMFVPPGISEGLAVYRESEVTEGAGRLNHPYFTMQARASIEAGNRSLAQLLETPSFTRPFDRFYKGGSFFVDFLVQTYGTSAVERIFSWQQNIPILGFGANLWYATGESPKMIGNRFSTWFSGREDSIRTSLGDITTHNRILGRKGLINRKPQWLTDSTLVVFSLAYNQERGFQKVDLAGKTTRLSQNEITDDAVFSLSSDTKEIYYSRYAQHPTSAITQTSMSYALNLESGQTAQVPGSVHSYNPVKLGSGKILALSSEGQYNHIVLLSGKGQGDTRVSFRHSQFMSMSPRPGSDSVAVILNVSGHQSVYLLDMAQESPELRPWIGFGESTIYDGLFSADGRYYSFTSDRSGLLNAYVLDTREQRIWQVTNALYGAMEPAVSPSGKRIAYVEYAAERFDLKVADFDRDQFTEVSRDVANYTWTTSWESSLNEREINFSEEIGDVVDTPYRAIGRMKPRMVYPTAYLDTPKDQSADARLGFGIGTALQGSDPLGKLTYHGEALLQKGRLWGEVGIRSGAFALRPDITFTKRPETINAIISQSDGSTRTQRVIRDRSSVETGILLPYTIEQNVSRTSVISSLRLSYRSDIFWDDDFESLQSRQNKLSLLPAVYFGYKVARNPRDLIPHSGYSVSWFGEFDLKNESRSKNRGWMMFGNAYLPWLKSINTGIRLNVGVLKQNSASIFGLDVFKPKGWESSFLNDDTFMRYGLNVVQPVAFVDNGTMIVPAFLRSVYMYGFAEHLHRASDFEDNVSSVGGGLGVRFRMFSYFDFDLKWGAAYRIGDKSWRSHVDIIEG